MCVHRPLALLAFCLTLAAASRAPAFVFSEDFNAWPDGGCHVGSNTACRGGWIWPDAASSVTVDEFPGICRNTGAPPFKCFRGIWRGEGDSLIRHYIPGISPPSPTSLYVRYHFYVPVGSDVAAMWKQARAITASGTEMTLFQVGDGEFDWEIVGSVADGRFCGAEFVGADLPRGEWLKIEASISTATGPDTCMVTVTPLDGSPAPVSATEQVELVPTGDTITTMNWIQANASNFGVPVNITAYMDDVCVSATRSACESGGGSGSGGGSTGSGGSTGNGGGTLPSVEDRLTGPKRPVLIAP